MFGSAQIHLEEETVGSRDCGEILEEPRVGTCLEPRAVSKEGIHLMILNRSLSCKTKGFRCRSTWFYLSRVANGHVGKKTGTKSFQGFRLKE